MRFRATVESLGKKEYIGYIRVLSRSHLKITGTDLDAATFAIDLNEAKSVSGVEVFHPKKSWKKYRTSLTVAIDQLEKDVPSTVREELHRGIEKALDWMEDATKDLAEYEAASYVYSSD